MNSKRPGDDFAFQLTAQETHDLDIAKCDIKIGWWPAVSPLGFHRARSSYAWYGALAERAATDDPAVRPYHETARDRISRP
jgi:hypothetical protein